MSFAAWKFNEFSQRLCVRLIGLFLLVATERMQNSSSGLMHDVLMRIAWHVIDKAPTPQWISELDEALDARTP